MIKDNFDFENNGYLVRQPFLMKQEFWPYWLDYKTLKIKDLIFLSVDVNPNFNGADDDIDVDRQIDRELKRRLDVALDWAMTSSWPVEHIAQIEKLYTPNLKVFTEKVALWIIEEMKWEVPERFIGFIRKKVEVSNAKVPKNDIGKHPKDRPFSDFLKEKEEYGTYDKCARKHNVSRTAYANWYSSAKKRDKLISTHNPFDIGK